MKVQGGWVVKAYLYFFFNLGDRYGCVVKARPRPLYPRGKKNLVAILQEAGWFPGPVWTSAKNLAPIGTRSPDRPARSESLYRLSYPGPPRWACMYYLQYLLVTFQNERHIDARVRRRELIFTAHNTNGINSQAQDTTARHPILSSTAVHQLMDIKS